ncbi:hypothetical protein CNMCM8980_001670 [Aspergillus fumigatiaffinis]|nr:hypothetical protein CNMCM8980_001670 [Aspergillus fumigatiaffinis]
MATIARDGQRNIGSAGDDDHSRIRRVLAHAFSEKALYAQENILSSHVDHLIAKLQETSGQSTNAVRWIQHAIYDIIVYLTFGQEEDSLDHNEGYPPVRLVFEGFREAVRIVEILRFIPLKNLVLKALMWGFAGAQVQKFKVAVERTESRLKRSDSEIPDFMSYILRANETERELSQREITANCAFLISAGAHSTASMICGCLYNLSKNPDCLKKLAELLRSTYARECDITLRKLAQLPYLQAVLDESMRLYMPVPASLPRTVPPEGAIICGHYVPPGVSVAVNQYAAFHSADNFAEPLRFIPERWLGDSRFVNDQKHVFQPFTIGPRACLGKNLAYAEIRLVIARIVWRFSLEIMPDSQNWHVDQRAWLGWKKPKLNMKFIPRDI